MALSLASMLWLVLILVASSSNSTPTATTWPTTTDWRWTSSQSWYWTSSPSPGRDLTGRMFSVMSGSVVTFRGFPRYQDTRAFTVCLRIISESVPGTALFTMTMSNSATLTVRSTADSGYELTVGQASKTLYPVAEVPSFGKLYPWTSLCATWDSATGMTQMWKDGKMSVRKGMWRSQSFYGPPAMTLSGFEGQVTDIHVWDKALPLSSLRSYNQGWGYPSGNLLSWREASYTSQGYAVLEDAYSSQVALGKEDRTGKPQRRHWKKHGKLGYVVQEGPESEQRCLGLRKRCGKRQELLE
ncbi:serum amyloid P-component-like [Alosa pseudoharengus]|uniref:serum amyloid P-component-like n=1 Tax=Alosa pseudoharengus TaxID=34774 RepID=UPI003F8ACFE0